MELELIAKAYLMALLLSGLLPAMKLLTYSVAKASTEKDCDL